MKYFYLTADGTTAGPEPLETLCAMMNSGSLSLPTLVVPAGGEDWTPLARVLRYFYQDASGATAGPVVFSELDRLCQIHAIPTDAWVVEESGTGWKAAAAALSAGGVKLPAAPATPRVVQATYRPQQATMANPYAAPKAPVGQRTVVRHRKTGGIGRLWFFLGGFILFVASILLLVAFFWMKLPNRTLDGFDLDNFIRDFLILYVSVLVILFIGGTWLSVLRIQNIGWSGFLVLAILAPSIGTVLGESLHVTATWFYLILGLLGIFALIFQVSLLILPPGFARHKRMDTAAWIILMVLVLLFAGAVTYTVTRKASKTPDQPAKPAPAAIFLPWGS